MSMLQERLREIYAQKAMALGGNYLDGSGMCGGNYLDGGKLTKAGIKKRESKTVRKRKVDYVRKAPTEKRANPWLEYVDLERAKKVNAKLTYREILQNIDKDAYARWKKRNYPEAPKAAKSPVRKAKSPKAKSPKAKSPAKPASKK